MASKSWIRRLFAQKKSSSYLKGATTKKPVQVPLDIELLELRQLLSVTASFASSTLTLTDTTSSPGTNVIVGEATSGGNNYIFVYNNATSPGTFLPITGGTPSLPLSGGGTATGVLVSSVTQITYSGGSSTSNEILTLNGGVTTTASGTNTLVPYAAASSLTGGSGTNTLIGGTGNDTIVGGSGMNALTGGAGANTISDGANPAQATIFEKSGNTATTFIMTAGSVSLSGGQGSDTFGSIGTVNLLGGAGNDVFDGTGYTSAGNVVGYVINGGTAGSDVNTFLSGNSLTNDNFSLGVNTFSQTAGGTVSFSNVQLVHITGGPSDNTFNITGFGGGLASPGFANTSVTIDSNGGNDTVISSGVDYPSFALTDTSLTLGNGTVSQNNVLISVKRASLAGASGNDTFSLHGWTGAATIVGGTGANNSLIGPDLDPSTWNFSSATAGTINAGVNLITYSQIKNFAGGSGNDTFNLASNAAPTGTINGGGGTLNVLSYATFTQNISVSLSSGISGVSNIQSIAGGTGTNTLSGGTGNDAWTINGANSGFVTTGGNTTSFSAFQNLAAGGASDNFNFTLSGSIAGTLTGNGGANGSSSTLDYTGFNSAVNIQVLVIAPPNNAVSGTATGIAGGFSRITNLIGSSNSDTLKGGNAPSVWTVNSPGNGSYAANGDTLGFSSFENLIGGANNDTFNFPNGPQNVTFVDGGGGNNTLDYTGYTGNLSVQLANGGVSGVANISNIIGGTGNNSITGANAANAWTINGANSGFVVFGSNNDSFSNFQNITGGNGTSDNFGFVGTGSIAGSLTGVGANEVLDYGAFGSGVNISIAGAGSTATSISGQVGGLAGGIGVGFSGITSLRGSNFNDSLGLNGGTDNGVGWNVTSPNNGTVTRIGSGSFPVFPFTSIESLSSTTAPVAGADVFSFTGSSALLTGTVAGAGNDTLNYANYSGGPVFVNFGNHSATAIFGQQANGFSGISNFIGSGANTSFDGSNAGFNTFNINSPGTGNDVVTGGGTFTFSNVGNLVGGSQGNAFNFTANGSSLTGNISGIGNDSLSFAGHLSNGVAVTITNEGTNNSLANGSFVGFTGTATASILGGNFSGIGNLIGTGITGTSGDTLTGANSSGNEFVITGNDSGMYFTFFPNILNYSHVANLTGGNAASGDSFFFFGGAVSGHIDGGSAANGSLSFDSGMEGTVNVSLTSLRSGTATHVGSGFNHIANLNGESDHPTNVTLVGTNIAALYNWAITAPNQGTVTASSLTFAFQNVGNLTSGSTPSSADYFTFQHNTVDDNITGVLTGGAGNDTADYSAFTANQSIALGVNVVNIDTIIGGTGTNTITGANSANNWLISSPNNGTVNSVTFRNFANIVGNNVSDDFGFSTNGTLSGTLTGGAGTPEALDFSTHVTSVSVTLTSIATGSGTTAAITGGFAGLTSVIGTGNNTLVGAGCDTLTGDNGIFDLWFITAPAPGTGNDKGFVVGLLPTTTQLLAFSGFANLTGGTGVNVFAFGPNDNIFGKIDTSASMGTGFDFSSYGAPVTVNLQNNSATPIFNGGVNGFTNVTSVTGDLLGSTLIGKNVANNWTIFGDGQGTIDTNGVNFGGFTNLQGGTANDTFTMSADPGSGTQGLVEGHVWGGSQNITVEPNNGNNASGHDTLAYDSSYFNFGAGNHAQSVNLANGTATGINGGAPGGIASIDAISLSGNNNTISGNNFVINDHNAGTVDGVAFSNVENLVGAPGVDSFNFTSGISTFGSVDGTVTANAATAACNSLSYAGYPAANDVFVNLQDHSATGIDGGAANGFSNIDNFTGSANSALIGPNQDTAWTFSNSTAGSVANAAGVGPAFSDSFRNFATLQGGSANDSFTEAPNNQFAGAIDGGNGSNILTFPSYTTHVQVNLGVSPPFAVNNIQTILGGNGTNDSITGDAPVSFVGGHYLWHLRSPGNLSFVTDNNVPNDTVFFNGFENLTGSSADDTFFFGANSSVPGTLDGGTGNNTLDFSTDTFGQPIKLNLTPPGSVLTAANVPVVGSLVGSSFSKLVGSGTGTAGDTIIGANGADNSWSIIGPDAGVITQGSSHFSFAGVSNLVGGDGNDSFTFVSSSQITGTIDGAGGSNNSLSYSGYGIPIAVDLANASASEIFGGANNGFANISYLTGTGLTGTGGDTLYGATGDQHWTLANDATDTGSISPANFSYTGVANIKGNSGNDTFSFGNNSIVSGKVDGGSGTNNTLDFANDSAMVTVNLGTNSATPILGGANQGFANISFLFGGANTTLAGPDLSNLWSITSLNNGNLSNTNGVFGFSGVANLTGGTHDDTFVFSDGASESGNIDGGTGENIDGDGDDQGQFVDTLDYSAQNSPTTIDLHHNFNIESIIGSGNAALTLEGADVGTLWQLTAADGGILGYTDANNVYHAVEFQSIANLLGGNASNTFQVLQGGLTGSITGGAATGQTLDYSLAFNFGGGIAYTLTGANAGIDGSGFVAGGFSNIQNLIGSGITGVGGDTLTGACGTHTWNLSGPDAGSIVGSLGFSGISNLVGGPNSDTFAFGAGSSITGLLNGGCGTNTLDYTNFANAATISLLDRSATGIDGGASGGFANFGALKGTSLANDTTLRGSNATNTWNITGAGNGSVGGFNFTNVGNLVGGTGIDTFAFGANGNVTGFINGGGGAFDSLSYLLSGRNATVNLANATATGIGGTFGGISAATGALTAHGTIIGSNFANIWNVTLPDFGTVNGFTFTNFANLTGGSSASGVDTFNIASTGSISGTIKTGAGSNFLSIINGGNFVLADALVNYGGNATVLNGAFVNVSLTESAGGSHSFTVTGWTGADGLVYLTGGSGNDTVFDNTIYNLQLNNASLNSMGGYFATFVLTSIEAANLTSSGPAGLLFDVSGWTGSRTVSLDGGANGAYVGALGASNYVLSDSSLTRSVGGTATLTNISLATLTAQGTNETITLDGWSGSGFLAGAADNSTTLIDDSLGGDLTISGSAASGFLSTAAGLHAMSLSNINNAILQTESGSSVTIDASAYSGNTTLVGGAGGDLIKAGSGKSILLGSGGNETLMGGSGYDILVAGTGNDVLIGGSSAGYGSILIGGTLSSRYFTPFSLSGAPLTTAQISALSAVMAEWSSPGAGNSTPANLATRVNHLLNGGPINTTNLLNLSTVFSNGGNNTLTGDAGNDWYFYTNVGEIAAFMSAKDAKTKLPGV